MILGELGVKAKSHQPAFAAGLDIGQRGQRLGAQFTILENTQPPRSLGEQHAAIGSEYDLPRNLQSGNDGFDTEFHRAIMRAFRLARAPSRRRLTTSSSEK